MSIFLRRARQWKGDGYLGRNKSRTFVPTLVRVCHLGVGVTSQPVVTYRAGVPGNYVLALQQLTQEPSETLVVFDIELLLSSDRFVAGLLC